MLGPGKWSDVTWAIMTKRNSHCFAALDIALGGYPDGVAVDSVCDGNDVCVYNRLFVADATALVDIIAP